jgi:tetratricopeptide (TPR) repeat protein
MISSKPEEAAFALMDSGQFAQAEAAWREILARKPDDPNALHSLGCILAQTGRPAEALPFFDRAVERAPREAGIRGNRANVLASLGRDDDALRDARRALDLDPRLAAAYNLIGNVHLGRGRFDEAIGAYRRALALEPRMAPSHVGLGSALLGRGDRDGAIASYRAALAINPRDAAAHFNLGAVCESAEDFAGAEREYRLALESDPAHVAALNNLGVVLRRTEREPEARASFEAALRAAPEQPDALNNMGIAEQRAGRPDEAIAHFARATAARPQFARALVNWGNALQDKNELDAAEQRYRDAEAIAPGLQEARYARAQVALRQHRFAEGWAGNETRFGSGWPFVAPREFPMPRLGEGELAGGQRVFIWSEQGLGDQILYSTLLPELERRGVAAVVEVDARLLAAYRRSFATLEFVATGNDPGAYASCARHLPIASLALHLRPSVESFAAQPRALLSADPARADAMRARLGAGRWTAIAWRSLQRGERKTMADRKSIPLEYFARLAGIAGTRLLDLQYGDVSADRIAFHGQHPGVLARIDDLDAQDDLEGVLAALSACERVITSSNALAHLAGALGRPTWLVYLGGREPFYYWVPGADGRSLWYPSVEIVSERSWTSWDQAFDALAARLAR